MGRVHWLSVAPCKDGFIHFSEGQVWSHPMCGRTTKQSSSYVVLRLHMIEKLEKDYLMCRECWAQAKSLFD